MSELVYKQALISDLKDFVKKHGKASRDKYRSESWFRHNWEKYWDSWAEFKSEAFPLQVDVESVQDTPSSIPVKEELEYKGDSFTINLEGTSIHTLDALLDHFKVDESEWEVVTFKVNTWQMGYKDNQGDAKSHPLYQFKATLKKKVYIIDAKSEIESLKEDAKNYSHIPYRIDRNRCDSTGNMVEIMMPDSHLGKLAYGRETGHEDWDLGIAVDT